MIAPMKPKRCLVPGCKAEVGAIRGVCTNCYQTAKRLVDRGMSSWEELESCKLILPPYRHRIEDLPMFVALEAARKAKGGKRTAKAGK